MVCQYEIAAFVQAPFLPSAGSQASRLGNASQVQAGYAPVSQPPVAEPVQRRQRAKHVIDAPWLDQAAAAKHHHHQQQQQQPLLTTRNHQQQLASLPQQQYGTSSSAQGLDGMGQSSVWSHSMDLAASQAAGGVRMPPLPTERSYVHDTNSQQAVRTSSQDNSIQKMQSLLRQLQEQQEHMREEYARQAAALEQLTTAQRGLPAADPGLHDVARADLARVRQQLGQEASRDALQAFMVETHLVRTSNCSMGCREGASV